MLSLGEKKVWKWLQKFWGADHILYGSSYPVKMEWMLNGVAMVNSLDLPQEDINKMVSENALQLYGVLK